MTMDFVRSFGPAYCDLPTMVSNVATLLRIFTVNIERNYTQRIPIIFYFIQIVSGACYFHVFLISMMWFVFVKCRETKDMVTASVVFSLGTCGITGVAKLFYIRFHIETIRNLVDEYLACDAAVDSGTRFYRNLLRALHNVKIRAVGFWVFITLNGLVYIFAVICLPERHFFEVYGLDPMSETPNYAIAMALMAAGVFFANQTETDTTAFFIIITGYVEAQMLALSQELDNVWNDANTLYQDKVDMGGKEDKDVILHKRVRNLLRDIAKKHIIIIKHLGKVEKVFRNVMAIEFGFLTLGLIAELLGGLENTFVQLPYTLIQVAVDCFVGQRLIDASSVLSNSIYNCKWEMFDTFNQKTVYLMLMNSQKTLSISVAGLKVLSFSYFMSVLNSIYSAYTTLRTII